MKEALLEEPGLEVIGEASSVDHALRMLREAVPDVIIMDICLPERGGLEITPLLLEQAPQARVILLTEQGDSRYQRAAASNGASACVRKDLIATALVGTVKMVLEASFGARQDEPLSLMKEKLQ
jgi:DNA-binding NarL/FixJ family response regulator